ncbi:MAG TPA: FkbM family methyltransferase [Candidatus Solibacter sp.]|nr:FkbM family methyltransferase [Candidatus Solibacter sp.]
MSLSKTLAELTSERIDRAYEFDRIAAPDRNPVLILGTGHLGQWALAALRQAGIQMPAFCDNNSRLWGSLVEGIPVMGPEEALKRFPGAAVVVAIYNSTAPQRQLRALGCERVVPYPVLFWRHSQFMPREDRLELPHVILSRTAEMPAGYDLLADDSSRREFCAQIRWRCSLDYGCLPAPDSPSDMYYPADLFALRPDETLVDCGAFDGDSIRSFLDKSGGRFERIHALEADSKNLSALRRYVDRLDPGVGVRIAIHPYAVSSRNGTLRFSAEGSVGSRVDESGTEVECRTLDTLLSDAEPTFIKMDIEGAEPDALEGARELMAKHRPVMAVCAYHKCDHLWILPQLLKAGNPAYSIFLRRYAEDCWETVFYAVPPERSRMRP